MECARARELLSPYLDGELESAEQVLLSSHLRSCSACRRELAELEAALGILRGLPELAPAHGFSARLRERLAEESNRQHSGTGPDWELRGRPTPGDCGAGGVRIWPRLAAAAVFVLAVGIASLWAGLGGWKTSPPASFEKVSHLSWQKDQSPRSLPPEPPASPELARKDRQEAEQFAPNQEEMDLRLPALEAGGAGQREENAAAQAAGEPPEKGAAAGSGEARVAEPLPKSPESAAVSVRDTDEGKAALIMTAAPPEKVARKVKIELRTADVEKLGLFLSGYASGQDRQDVAADPDGKPNYRKIIIPVSRMPDFLQEIETHGVILKQEETEQDLTGEYLDLTGQLKQLEEREKILLAQEKNNRGKREAELALQQEIENLQAEIHLLKERLAQLDEQASFVSVEICWRE